MIMVNIFIVDDIFGVWKFIVVGLKCQGYVIFEVENGQVVMNMIQ